MGNLWQRIALGLILICYSMTPKNAAALEAELGVTDTSIRIGAIMPLTGDSNRFFGLSYYGLHMKKGIEAALSGQIVNGRKIEFEVINDFDDSITTVQVAREMIDKGIFLMLGNVGALSTLKLMPVLKANQIPAMGFYILGDINADNLLNYRPNPVQEVTTLIENTVVKKGVKPTQVCVFAQNDIFGIAGIDGLKAALKKFSGTEPIISKLDSILDMMMGGINSALNDIGPVGFYKYETVLVREGYASLKNWEKQNGDQCQFVVLVAIPKVAADFIAYAHQKNESWSFGVISATAAGYALKDYLNTYNIDDKIITTQVVPSLDSSLPIVVDARNALGEELNHINLEGFIVGRMFIAILKSMKDPITRDNFKKAARQKILDIGGLKIDFTNENSGSNLMLLNQL